MISEARFIKLRFSGSLRNVFSLKMSLSGVVWRLRNRFLISGGIPFRLFNTRKLFAGIRPSGRRIMFVMSRDSGLKNSMAETSEFHSRLTFHPDHSEGGNPLLPFSN
jgi:hypothetical protein